MNTSVTSLAKSKELQSCGFPQEGRLFYWYEKISPAGEWTIISGESIKGLISKHEIAAPTVTEIALEMPLSARERILRSYMHDPDEWAGTYCYLNPPLVKAERRIPIVTADEQGYPFAIDRILPQ